MSYPRDKFLRNLRSTDRDYDLEERMSPLNHEERGCKEGVLCIFVKTGRKNLSQLGKTEGREKKKDQD